MKGIKFSGLSTSTHQLFGSILCIILGSRKLTDVWPLSLDRLHVAPRDPPPKPPQPIRKTPYLQRSNALLLFLLPLMPQSIGREDHSKKTVFETKKSCYCMYSKFKFQGLISKKIYGTNLVSFPAFSSFCLSNFWLKKKQTAPTYLLGHGDGEP